MKKGTKNELKHAILVSAGLAKPRPPRKIKSANATKQGETQTLAQYIGRGYVKRRPTLAKGKGRKKPRVISTKRVMEVAGPTTK